MPSKSTRENDMVLSRGGGQETRALIVAVFLLARGQESAGRCCLITLTLQAEATTVLALSEARQNISNPWPYLQITKQKINK